MSLREDLSCLLKKAKKDSNYTYAELSDQTGCSITSVRYALNGGENVGLDTFEKLFDFIGYKVVVK